MTRAICVSLLLVLASLPAHAATPAETGSRTTVDRYLRAFQEGGMARFLEVFDEAAVFVLVDDRARAKTGSSLVRDRLSTWSANPERNARIENLSIACANDQICVATFVLHMGGAAYHDALTLIPRGNAWRVLTKTTRLLPN